MSNPILMFIDFVDDIVAGKDKKTANLTVLVAYTVFITACVLVYRDFTDRDFSAVMTLGSAVQCFGFFLLLHKVKISGSVAGISSKTLEMYALVLMFRLSSTLFRQGYLPIDRSGDWIYQAADVSSLLLVFQLLYCVRKKHRDTYQDEYDTLPIWRAVPGCMILGYVLRGSLNHSLFFDVMWCVAMNIDVVAMLPQLFMLVKKGGEVEALTSNYIASIFISRFCVLAFWWHGHTEINAKPDVPSRLSGWWVVAAHGLMCLLSADFMFHYCMAKTGMTSGGCASLTDVLASGSRSRNVVLPVANIEI